MQDNIEQDLRMNTKVSFVFTKFHAVEKLKSADLKSFWAFFCLPNWDNFALKLKAINIQRPRNGDKIQNIYKRN